MKYNYSSSQSAFTLVELSIVLVIIALLIAAVTAGKSLVRASQVRKIVNNIYNLETAVNSFYDRYNALPGDMANASTVFAGATNGDGNGLICPNANVTGTESYHAFAHLYRAGLTDTIYNGGNLLEMQYQGKRIFFSIRYAQGDSATGIFGRAGHIIDVGTAGVPPSYLAFNYAFTAVQAQEIDTKIDDGIANTGSIYGVGGSTTTGCSGWTNGTGYDYKLNRPGIECQIAYWMKGI